MTRRQLAFKVLGLPLHTVVQLLVLHDPVLARLCVVDAVRGCSLQQQSPKFRV